MHVRWLEFEEVTNLTFETADNVMVLAAMNVCCNIV